MEPNIAKLDSKKLIGMRTVMSVANNQTHTLWRNFMPRRNEVPNRKNTYFYSLEVYPSIHYFREFAPTASFEKWAAVEVESWENIPEGMETLAIPEGLYAVFAYRGTQSEAAKFYQYIYGSWMPQSAYLLDERPHFALMGDRYRGDDPESEEDIYIPVVPKN